MKKEAADSSETTSIFYCCRRKTLSLWSMWQELHPQRRADTSQAHTLGTAALRMHGVRQAFWAQGPLEEARADAPTETACHTASAAATVFVCGLLEWRHTGSRRCDLPHSIYSESLVCGKTLWSTQENDFVMATLLHE
jgi:hypothetical protein